MRFVKEAVKLGVMMFAGQLVADGLRMLFERAKEMCAERKSGCCVSDTVCAPQTPSKQTSKAKKSVKH